MTCIADALMAVSCIVLHPPASNVACLGSVKEANVLSEQGVEQLGANAHVEAGHAQGEQASSGSREHSTPKGYHNKLQGCLLEFVAVWLNGGIIYDLSSVVWD